jgi:hypothetical protein
MSGDKDNIGMYLKEISFRVTDERCMCGTTVPFSNLGPEAPLS